MRAPVGAGALTQPPVFQAGSEAVIGRLCVWACACRGEEDEIESGIW